MKPQYTTRKRALFSAHAAARNQGKSFRAYRCPDCHFWHLTTSGIRTTVVGGDEHAKA
jgi:hypothetical protein